MVRILSDRACRVIIDVYYQHDIVWRSTNLKIDKFLARLEQLAWDPVVHRRRLVQFSSKFSPDCSGFSPDPDLDPGRYES